MNSARCNSTGIRGRDDDRPAQVIVRSVKNPTDTVASTGALASGVGAPVFNAPDVLPLFQKTRDFQNAAKIRAMGLYPYFRTIASAQDTEVLIGARRS